MSAEFTAEQTEQGVSIKVDGQLFTEYLIKTGPKPILWPVIGPTGAPMTRDYPMKTVEGEKQDHPHQRSLWFTHGDVNGIDFWSEIKERGHGSIVHREYLEVSGGPRGTISTVNDWVGPDGKKHCEDQRTLVFQSGEGWRSIDFDITFKATTGPVLFGDTKEGCMGIRVPTTMDVNSGKGGRIVNSDGLTDDAAWGKPAPWVDYHGPIGEETLGVAILNHPTSFRYPTYWHVRTYGLFAANPFGLHDFKGSAEVDGAYTLEAGEEMALRYRFVFHKGDEKSAAIAAAFEAYAKEPK